jgi:hypothetical protein
MNRPLELNLKWYLTYLSYAQHMTWNPAGLGLFGKSYSRSCKSDAQVWILLVSGITSLTASVVCGLLSALTMVRMSR